MQTYADYMDIAVWCEEVTEQVALRTLGTTKVEQHDGDGDRARQAVGADHAARCDQTRPSALDYLEATREQLLRRLDDDADPQKSWAKLVEDVYSKHVEPYLIQPTHVFDFPLDLFPICKRHRDDPRLGEHFDTVIRGMEVLSGDTELNDPIDQWDRFVKQRSERPGDDGDQPQPHDEGYVRALEYGMAPTSGGGIGVDRLLMILSGAESIREVVPFPTLRELR